MTATATTRATTTVRKAADGTVTTTTVTPNPDGSKTIRTVVSRPSPASARPAAAPKAGVHASPAPSLQKPPARPAAATAAAPNRQAAVAPPPGRPHQTPKPGPQPAPPPLPDKTASGSRKHHHDPQGAKPAPVKDAPVPSKPALKPTAHPQPETKPQDASNPDKATVTKRPAAPAEPEPETTEPEAPFEIECLEGHNRLRQLAGVKPLAWSSKLTDAAKRWADHLADAGVLEHSYGRVGRWGENLYMVVSSVPHGHRLAHVLHGHEDDAQRSKRICKAALDAFFDERHKYHGEAISASNSRSFGHYTQLVWPSTTKLGAAIVTMGRHTVVVCEYWPPGNVVGQRAPWVRDKAK
ncbi:hypothetical protein HK105_201744 [Polyrhizophydium stewartii]|uniref:SCP domain-containing protein n=1 Tax=Polyrhizophydium stewartii TaxID=2732419 RepID=A0ABR4NHA4_9FUNG